MTSHIPGSFQEASKELLRSYQQATPNLPAFEKPVSAPAGAREQRVTASIVAEWIKPVCKHRV